jgi:hypothetical protein
VRAQASESTNSESTGSESAGRREWGSGQYKEGRLESIWLIILYKRMKLSL